MAPFLLAGLLFAVSVITLAITGLFIFERGVSIGAWLGKIFKKH